MNVELLHNTPLWVAARAIRKCWASEGKSDTAEELESQIESYFEEYGDRIDWKDLEELLKPKVIGEKDKELIDRIGNKNKHASTLEHLVYSFDIDGISRACLQELARHRIASLSVESSRYTLEKILDGVSNIEDCLVKTGDQEIDNMNILHMNKLKDLIKSKGKSLPRDISKYSLVESYKTSLVWTVNARSLQNFLSLRTSKAALWEIRDLANEIYNKLPEDHKYLFENCTKEPDVVTMTNEEFAKLLEYKFMYENLCK